MSAMRSMVLAAAMCAACAPELNWRVWRSDDFALTQMFPCKPWRQQRAVNVAGRDLVLVLHACDAGQMTWAVAYADVQDPLAMGDVLAGLTSAAHANLGSPQAQRMPANVAGGTPQPMAGRFRLRGHPADGRRVDGALLVFARGTMAVQVTVLGSPLRDDDVETFIGSVRAGP